MFAIIENGGKQYKVTKDSVINLEKLNMKPGNEIVFSSVLLAAKDDSIQVGQPYIKGAKVTGEVLRALKAKKQISFKYRRRKSSKTKIGHRQKLTCVKIKEIKIG